MPATKRQIDKALSELLFRHREENFTYGSFRESLLLYRMVQRGDTDIRSELLNTVFTEHNGRLSKDPFRQDLYLFICLAARLSHFCIESGLGLDTAYGLSDLYIQTAEGCPDTAAIRQLAVEMAVDYASRMRSLRKGPVRSRAIAECMDYIEEHLHDAIPVDALAAHCGLSPDHLIHLFKKETGMPPAGYVRSRRIEAAGILLRYSSYSCSDIAEYLHFSSVSHMSRLFRKQTGLSPSEYRRAQAPDPSSSSAS